MQLARAKEDASTSRTEAARARAEAEFERERCNRVTEALEMQVRWQRMWGAEAAMRRGNCLHGAPE